MKEIKLLSASTILDNHQDQCYNRVSPIPAMTPPRRYLMKQMGISSPSVVFAPGVGWDSQVLTYIQNVSLAYVPMQDFAILQSCERVECCKWRLMHLPGRRTPSSGDEREDGVVVETSSKSAQLIFDRLQN